MNYKYLFWGLVLFLTACKDKVKPPVDTSYIDVSVIVNRFDKAFFEATKENFTDIKKQYPLLFPKGVQDSIWWKKIQNPYERSLYKKVQNTFGNFSKEKGQLKHLFQKISHYDSTFISPKIITLISDLDYENRVIYADSLLLISLDMYLGKKDTCYAHFPDYLKIKFNKEQLLPNVADVIINKQFRTKHQRQFIYTLIDEGKKMYTKDLYLPEFSDAVKMGYTEEQLHWVKNNEMPIWKYFIENKLLYSTDTKLRERFISEAPFSKFYMEIDQESPGRIGVWLGWRIVRSFMKNNDVSLQKLWATDALTILKKSKYKPNKNGN